MTSGPVDSIRFSTYVQAMKIDFYDYRREEESSFHNKWPTRKKIWISNEFIDTLEGLENFYVKIHGRCWIFWFSWTIVSNDILEFTQIFFTFFPFTILQEARDVEKIKQNEDLIHWFLSGRVFSLKQKQICGNKRGKRIETFSLRLLSISTSCHSFFQ